MTAALSSVEIMMTWMESSDNLNVQVEYSIHDKEFSDYRLLDRNQMRLRIDPHEECLRDKNKFYSSFCDVLFQTGRCSLCLIWIRVQQANLKRTVYFNSV